MKKSLFVLAFFSIANTALPKEKAPIVLRSPCAILYDNMYNYLTQNGYPPCQAQEVSAAAFTQCLTVK